MVRFSYEKGLRMWVSCKRAVRACLVLVASSATFAAAAPAPSWPEGAKPEVLRTLPVQHDGRVMPLDTLAREAVWNVSGQRDWGGLDPVALVVDWSVDPFRWAREPMVRVRSPRSGRSRRV